MTRHISLLYFASLSEKLNCEQEQVELPQTVETIEQLRSWLAQRPGPWAQVLASDILSAANQNLCPAQYRLQDGDEIAFFPPVTGG